jgi:hypothetical protein
VTRCSLVLCMAEKEGLPAMNKNHAFIPGTKPCSVRSLLYEYNALKVHKIENFFDSDFGICIISLLVLSKY